jgi:transcriptional regulator with XRE-family HTH domain
VKEIFMPSSTTKSPSVPVFDFSILRDLRKREGLTLADMSRQTGVSTSVISKLERNRTQAELETLYKLSRVFGISATDLLSLAESRIAHRKTSVEYASDEFLFRRVRYANLTCLHGTARAGGTVSRPEVHRDDYEVCWVLKGTVRITLPDEQYDLQEGEALQFDAILEHTYQALADCEIVILHLTKGNRF